jgi:hypothetical protein
MRRSASHQLFEPSEQRINVAVHAVWRHAGAGRAIGTERAHERLGAMVAAAQRNA